MYIEQKIILIASPQALNIGTANTNTIIFYNQIEVFDKIVCTGEYSIIFDNQFRFNALSLNQKFNVYIA